MKASIKVLAGIAICISLASSFLLLSGPNLALLFATEVTFEEIDWGGMSSAYESRANLTIRNARNWNDLWLEIHGGDFPIPETPVVNFTSEMVIAVFQGYCGSGGYSTNITKIVMTDSYYLVYVNELHPGEGCITTTVITHPYHIVKITGYPLNLPVEFIYDILVYDCE